MQRGDRKVRDSRGFLDPPPLSHLAHSASMDHKAGLAVTPCVDVLLLMKAGALGGHPLQPTPGLLPREAGSLHWGTLR